MRFRDRWLREHYQALARRNESVRYSGKPFDDFAMRTFLDAVLATPSVRASLESLDRPPCALEYGTGTGPGACCVAERGFRVDAIDVSPEAIDLARRFARARGLSISFEVESIVSFSRPPGSYDLVLDNHCLHHITGREERMQALSNVRRLLRPSGIYVLETVVQHDGRDYGRDRFDARSSMKLARIDDQDPDFDGTAYEDVVRIDGHWYWARSLHRRPAELKDELERSGLRVVFQSHFGGLFLCVPDDAGPSTLASEIQRVYRDDSVAESIRLKHPIVDAPA